jgi:CRP-like cAMP-binding protein
MHPDPELHVLHDILNGVHPLPGKALETLAVACSPVHKNKGEMLFRAERLESRIYFIEKGIVRAFCDQAAHEVTFWFGREGDVVLSYNSYIHNRPGYEYVELLEDARLFQLSCDTLQTLFTRDIDIANWGRKMAEKELVKTEERLISRQFKTAAERYSELLQQSPELLQRVQLGHIASYLGINQVTLSRIRAQVK